MMDELTAAASVALVVYRELEEDYVGLWVIPWQIRRAIPRASDEMVREVSIPILLALLENGISIGDLNGEMGLFEPWQTDEPIERVLAGWHALGRDPNIGEIAWLARTF
ncbi:hypothetical protein [Microbacterium azadirachtae]|uniref:hypothetical protein n=1 Tax=Microbacterium azadirachtae TaxID=582680 RepID=UPI001113BE56|nr:hypothetical protein [Microbacterium azadirachtae]